ncbi:MAG: hypothetical protein QXX20_05865 [Candidatus Thermoplasmatota archaeon]
MKNESNLKYKAIISIVLLTSIYLVGNALAAKSNGPDCWWAGPHPPYVGQRVNHMSGCPGGWGIYTDTVSLMDYSVRVGWCSTHNQWEIIYVHNNPTPIPPPTTTGHDPNAQE